MSQQTAEVINERLYCTCGTHTDLENMVNNMDLDIDFNTSTSIDEEIECQNCGRLFNVELHGEVTVDIDGFTEELKTIFYKDADNQDIPSSYFNDLMIGSKTDNLIDNEYIIRGLIYDVVNNEIINIFSTDAHPEQMVLEI